MNNITEITKRDIFDLFKNGYTEYEYFSNQQNHFEYFYYGKLDEMDFLDKLYPLDEIPGKYDSDRTARDDINKYVIYNYDWEYGWVFTDDRFELLHGSDTKLLDFLCAVFHPANRDDSKNWKSFFHRINNLLKQDGYELYEESKISGRSVYSYRQLTKQEIISDKFIPYSVRYKIVSDNSFSIPMPIRKEIYDLFEKHNETQHKVDETNWHYEISSKEALMVDIREYYTPKAFVAYKIHSETDDLETFIMQNYPYYVFDAIELFAQYKNGTFSDEVNLIFQNHNFSFKLADGKIERTKPIFTTKELIKEPGLRDLIDHADLLYRSNNISDKQTAVEKLWDAFERLKTYYDTGNKKKASVEKIISKISKDNENYFSLFKDEFDNLTKIGNDYRIRHHERNKIDITDTNYYDYFYHRCLALINLALKYLK